MSEFESESGSSASGTGDSCVGDTDTAKEVLVVFRDRRRPVRFISSVNPTLENKRLLEAVEETFQDVLQSAEGSSLTSGYYLQRNSKVWGRIDLNSKESIQHQT